MGTFLGVVLVVILTALPLGLWFWARWLIRQPEQAEDDSAHYLYGWLVVAIFSLAILALYTLKTFILVGLWGVR